jgi:hypothetical protein
MKKTYHAIIEHPRRGVLSQINPNGHPSFSPTARRDDPDRTWIFSKLVQAERALEKMPSPYKQECSIMLYSPNRESYYKLVPEH